MFFKKLRQPLDDRFLLLRAIASTKAGNRRQNFINIRAGRFGRSTAERIVYEALRFCWLQLFLRNDFFQFLLLLLPDISLPVAVKIRLCVDGLDKAVNQFFFAAKLETGIDGTVERAENVLILAIGFVVFYNQHQAPYIPVHSFLCAQGVDEFPLQRRLALVAVRLPHLRRVLRHDCTFESDDDVELRHYYSPSCYIQFLPKSYLKSEYAF